MPFLRDRNCKKSGNVKKIGLKIEKKCRKLVTIGKKRNKSERLFYVASTDRWSWLRYCSFCIIFRSCGVICLKSKIAKSEIFSPLR